MTCKKTWFSYILWAFYSIIVCICLSMGILLFASGRMDRLMMIGIVCLFFLGLTAIFYLGQLLINRIGEDRRIHRRAAFVAELLLVLAGTVGSVIWQLLLLFSVNEEQLAQTDYLVNSFVTGNSAVMKVSYGAEWVFLNMLHVLFLFVGNHVRAALLLQLVLQLAGSILLYRGIRKLYGRVAGVSGFFGMMLVPVFLLWRMGAGIVLSEVLKPFWAVYFFFSIGFYLLCSELSAYRNGKMRSKAAYFRVLALGFYLALVLYLDIYGVLLILLGGSILWCVSAEEEKRTKLTERFLAVFCLFAGVIAGMLLLFGLEAWVYGQSFGKTAEEWWLVYVNGSGMTFVPGYKNSEAFVFTCLSILLFWGSFCFLKDAGKDWMSSMFPVFIAAAILQAVGIGTVVSDQDWLFCVMVICAAVSLGQSVRPVQKREVPEQTTKQKEGQTAELKAGQRKEQTPEQTSEPVKPPEKPAEALKIKLLENPLPGPKKHVPKTLDYDLKDGKAMDYDLQVDDADDFDLK